MTRKNKLLNEHEEERQSLGFDPEYEQPNTSEANHKLGKAIAVGAFALFATLTYFGLTTNGNSAKEFHNRVTVCVDTVAGHRVGQFSNPANEGLSQTAGDKEDQPIVTACQVARGNITDALTALNQNSNIG